MKNYQDIDTKQIWAFASDGSQDDYITANLVPISDADLAILRAPSPPTIKQQLAQLDADNTLTQRNLRETVMLMAEAFKAVSNNAIDLSHIPGVAKVIAVEAEATALRVQL